MSFFGTWRRTRQLRPTSGRRARLQVEALESRLVPYALSGNAWMAPQLVTISFVPDGTIVGTTNSGPVHSNLFAVMNKTFGSPAVWEGAILKAAQSWAQQTNINFTVVSDNGTAIGQGSYQQGDPGMGDIRIGGYALGSYLGVAYMPPPANNYSISGDLQLNTATSWKVPGKGGTYDLATVAAHELGHALGLDHSSTSSATMYATYNGVKATLSSDDVAGIRANYSSGNGRSPDAYDATAANNTVGTATNLNSQIDPNSLTALVQNLDITTTSDVDYYTFTAPDATSGNLQVTVQSTDLSLLTPTVTVYDADGSTVLGSATAAGNLNGGTLTINLSGVTPGHQYFVKVAGADSSAMSTGAYALALNFGTGASSSVAPAHTTLANGTPIHGGGGQGMNSGIGLTPLIQFLSSLLDLPFQVIAGLLDGSADTLSATPGADAHLESLLAQYGPGSLQAAPTQPGHAPAAFAAATNLNAAPAAAVATPAAVSAGLSQLPPAAGGVNAVPFALPLPAGPVAQVPGLPALPAAASLGSPAVTELGEERTEEREVVSAPAWPPQGATPENGLASTWSPAVSEFPGAWTGPAGDNSSAWDALDGVLAQKADPETDSTLLPTDALGPSALAGLALVLGGSWAGQPTEQERKMAKSAARHPQLVG